MLNRLCQKQFLTSVRQMDSRCTKKKQSQSDGGGWLSFGCVESVERCVFVLREVDWGDCRLVGLDAICACLQN